MQQEESEFGLFTFVGSKRQEFQQFILHLPEPLRTQLRKSEDLRNITDQVFLMEYYIERIQWLEDIQKRKMS